MFSFYVLADESGEGAVAAARATASISIQVVIMCGF